LSLVSSAVAPRRRSRSIRAAVLHAALPGSLYRKPRKQGLRVMLSKAKKPPSIAETDPGLASQYKLDLVRLIRQRRGHEASLAGINEKIAQIEQTFGDRADALLDAWGFQA
jgi:hypothetical protein